MGSRNGASKKRITTALVKGDDDIKIKVSNIKIIKNIPTVKAFATIIIDDVFIVKDIRLIETSAGKQFIDFPAKVSNKGYFSCIAHPIDNDVRRQISSLIINEYKKQNTITHTQLRTEKNSCLRT